MAWVQILARLFAHYVTLNLSLNLHGWWILWLEIVTQNWKNPGDHLFNHHLTSLTQRLQNSCSQPSITCIREDHKGVGRQRKRKERRSTNSLPNILVSLKKYLRAHRFEGGHKLWSLGAWEVNWQLRNCLLFSTPPSLLHPLKWLQVIQLVLPLAVSFPFPPGKSLLIIQGQGQG